MSNPIIKKVNKLRDAYRESRDPHDGRISAFESAVNMGRFHELDVYEALATGHLVKGEMQSFYVRLV